jgi:hypothetical protein
MSEVAIVGVGDNHVGAKTEFTVHPEYTANSQKGRWAVLFLTLIPPRVQIEAQLITALLGDAALVENDVE